MIDSVTGKYIPNEFEKELIAALRSGKYKQGVGALRTFDGGFCCLGVACDISKSGSWNDNGLDDISYVSTSPDRFAETSLLPFPLMQQFGWKSSDGALTFTRRNGFGNNTTLTFLNDHGVTFDQIADIIEAGLVE